MNYLDKKNLRESVYFGSLFQCIVYHDGEGMVAEARGGWLHCIYYSQETKGDEG